ncbi:uncharacterized mitochondrial protein AtMg00810-like [Lathyrus oleraceus]|uniref:uncharacterized mitochondrial protein AtMg00810-like n=1 Tax=Pisum sativum TaxID=3888 RepID=UPI0021D21711|nr:uncharacterized mitochondrial protein AtMg00810-like [Pisum sativum]
MEGIYYFDTFSPVAKITTVRVLLSLAAVKGWYLEQLDVNNAFLHGDLHEEVYMTLPPGLSDYGNSLSEIQQVKHLLNQKFRFKELGQLCFFLGFEIAGSPTGIFFNQRKYALELLEDDGLLVAKPSAVPFNLTLKLSIDEGNVLEDPSLYRRLIGRLIYLTNSRPDIAFAVQHLSQHVSKPRAPHYQAAIQIFRYLKSIPAKGIFFSFNNKLQLFGFADSDWARCPDTRKSVTGYCVMLGSSLLC